MHPPHYPFPINYRIRGGIKDEEEEDTGIEKSSTVKTRRAVGEERKESLLKSQSQTFYKCTKTFSPPAWGRIYKYLHCRVGKVPRDTALPPPPKQPSQQSMEGVDQVQESVSGQ